MIHAFCIGGIGVPLLLELFFIGFAYDRNLRVMLLLSVGMCALFAVGIVPYSIWYGYHGFKYCGPKQDFIARFCLIWATALLLVANPVLMMFNLYTPREEASLQRTYLCKITLLYALVTVLSY